MPASCWLALAMPAVLAAGPNSPYGPPPIFPSGTPVPGSSAVPCFTGCSSLAWVSRAPVISVRTGTDGVEGAEVEHTDSGRGDETPLFPGRA